MPGQEFEGASRRERLIEACRRDNVDLLKEVITEILAEKPKADIAQVLNETTTVMGNHLYHEAASYGNYDVIDYLLDQDGFECDPLNRIEGDTPLHSAIRWINSEPPAQRDFGKHLVNMMLEAGSDTRIKNKGGLTPCRLVDPSNQDLRQLIQQHEYTNQNAGDFVTVAAAPSAPAPPPPPAVPAAAGGKNTKQQPVVLVQADDEGDEDAEFSGSDEEERAEWERRRKQKKTNGGKR